MIQELTYQQMLCYATKMVVQLILLLEVTASSATMLLSGAQKDWLRFVILPSRSVEQELHPFITHTHTNKCWSSVIPPPVVLHPDGSINLEIWVQWPFTDLEDTGKLPLHIQEINLTAYISEILTRPGFEPWSLRPICSVAQQTWIVPLSHGDRLCDRPE